MTNGTKPTSNIYKVLMEMPDEVVLKWTETIRKTYNIHPNPESSIEELRVWISAIEDLVIPNITGKRVLDPGQEIDPFLGGTEAQWQEVTRKIDEEDHHREENLKKIRACSNFKNTDFGNSERFMVRYGDQVRYCKRFEVPWLVWDPETGTWSKDEKGCVSELAKHTLIAIYSECNQHTDEDHRIETAKWAIKCEKSHHMNEVLTLVSTKPEIAAVPDEFDQDDDRVCLKNGVLNLVTHQLEPHNRDQKHTRYSPVLYDPARKCPLWTRFLDRIFRGRTDKDDLIAFLQRAAGYTLTGSIGEQCMFLLYGSGANGKSVFLEVLRAVMGSYAQVVDSSTFTTSRSEGVRNDLAALAGVRLVTTNENPKNSVLDEALIKEITGERCIKARFLFNEFFEYRPRFKIWWAFNHRPGIRDSSHSIWRRIRLIPFTEQIPAEEQNPHLAEELIRTELAGIFNWCHEGLMRYQEDGLIIPAAVKAATADYREDSDVLHLFFSELCITPDQATSEGLLSADISESSRNLYQAYSAWCGFNNERQLSSTKFGKELQERGLVKEHGMKGNRWRGIMLRKNWQEMISHGV